MFGILIGFVRGIQRMRVALSLQVDRTIFTKSSIIFTSRAIDSRDHSQRRCTIARADPAELP
jgi:hypothetical protein